MARTPIQYFARRLAPLFGAWLLAGHLIADTLPPPTQPVKDYLNRASAGFSPFTEDVIVRQGPHLKAYTTVQSISVIMPAERPQDSTGLYIHAGDSLEFLLQPMESGASYFDFPDDSAISAYLARHFKDLRIPVKRTEGTSHYTFPYADQNGAQGYQLEYILPQMGIPLAEDGNLAYANLPEVRDAIASCLVQWVLLAESGNVVPTLQNGRVRPLPRYQVTELKAGEALLVGTVQPEQLAAPNESRTHYLWLFLGLVAGVAIMGVVVLALGKRSPRVPTGTNPDESGKVKEQTPETPRAEGGPQAEDTPLEPDDITTDGMKKLLRDADDHVLAELGAWLGNAVKSEAIPLNDWLVGHLKRIDALSEQAPDPVEAIAIISRLLQELSEMATALDHPRGTEYFRTLQSRQAEAAVTRRILKSLQDGQSLTQSTEQINQFRQQLAERPEIPTEADVHFPAEQYALDLGRRLQRLENDAARPDQAQTYLSRLDQRLGRVLEQLGTMEDPPTPAQHAAILSTLFAKVLHLEDFLRIYLGAAHSEATRTNPDLIEQGRRIGDLDPKTYRHFEEDISRVPRSVRNLRAVARTAGVTQLDEVLVDGYYIPPSALQANQDPQ
ncbi:MAG: hypothetical protein AAF998_19685 [Bacteroidota bacterium]